MSFAKRDAWLNIYNDFLESRKTVKPVKDSEEENQSDSDMETA